MAGVYSSIAPTNIVSHATYSNSILNETISRIQNYTDVRAEIDQYFLLCGENASRKVSNVREARIQQDLQSPIAGLAAPKVFESDFGALPILTNRYVPKGTIMVLRKDLVKVRVMTGQSFKLYRFKDGESAEKGYIEGTYTCEFRNNEAHARLDGLA
jgi:hypothetical protein